MDKTIKNLIYLFLIGLILSLLIAPVQGYLNINTTMFSSCNPSGSNTLHVCSPANPCYISGVFKAGYEIQGGHYLIAYDSNNETLFPLYPVDDYNQLGAVCTVDWLGYNWNCSLISDVVGTNVAVTIFDGMSGHWLNGCSWHYWNESVSGGNTTAGNYTLSITPDSITINDDFSLTLTSSTGNFSGLSEIAYGWEKTSSPDAGIIYDFVNPTYALDYSYTGGKWYQYNSATGLFSIDKGTAFPNPVSGLGNFGVGDYIISAYIHKSTGEIVKVSDTLTITGDNNQELTIIAKDYEDGGIIGTAHIRVLDIARNTWDNRTAGGLQVFYYPFNQNLFITSSTDSTAYTDAFKNYTVTTDLTRELWLIMYRGVLPPISNVTLQVSVYDATDDSYVTNAQVRLSDNQIKYTGASGLVVFTVANNTLYHITTTKTGYQDSSQDILTMAGGTIREVSIIMHRTTTTPTLLTPVPTVSSGYIEGTGGNITPAICQLQLPAGSTILDSLKNSMACAGITSGRNQGFGIALMIIFTLGIIGGKYGRGMGVVMGMSAGYVLSLAMGLVPRWTFVAMIIFICLILSVKIWSTPA
jgi:hypothetical protein